jgi:hypothetical protein
MVFNIVVAAILDLGVAWGAKKEYKGNKESKFHKKR